MKSTIFFLFSVKNMRTKDSSADKSCGWQILPLTNPPLPRALQASRFLFAFNVILELEKTLEKFHSESQHQLRDKPTGAQKGLNDLPRVNH